MRRKLLYLVLAVLALLLIVSGVAAQGPNPAPATTITVTDSGDDYTDGKSKKCSDVPADKCTLRRAINQAYALPADSRPVAIEFDIPAGDPGCDAGLRVCKIQLGGSSLYDLRELSGQTIIDGSTQPGGRANGPKIVIGGTAPGRQRLGRRDAPVPCPGHSRWERQLDGFSARSVGKRAGPAHNEHRAR